MARKARAFSGAFVVMLIPLCMAGTTAFSAAKPGDPPIYNPASKSYFQLLKLTENQKKSWKDAHRAALSRTFKGVRGRLAVIDRPETHQFILQNFDLSRRTWIGLRYWCDYRMLMWSGQRAYSPAEPGHFQAWHPQWISSGHENTYCPSWWAKDQAYMAVFYETFDGLGARWKATGSHKGFGRFLVEFPLPQEE